MKYMYVYNKSNEEKNNQSKSNQKVCCQYKSISQRGHCSEIKTGSFCFVHATSFHLNADS